ncbi:MAG: AAA family ATPase [Nitrospira sp.]|nr:AAA family ATPase [Nitrospira sp.]
MDKLINAEHVKRAVTIDLILRAYGSTPGKNGRWPCIFPERHTNGDADPSVTIHGDTATCWSQQCFEQADIFQLVGLKEELRDFSEQKRRVLELAGLSEPTRQGLGPIVATYDYTDEDGTLLFQVVRYNPKDFRQRRPDGRGGWIDKLNGTRRVLYRLPDILRADHVLVVEGERDVDTAYRLGLPLGWAATCSPMGAEKWRTEYTDSLLKKHVVVLPDADEPGRRHGAQVVTSLHGKAASINVLSLPEGFKDLSEWAGGKTSGDLATLLEEAQPVEAATWTKSVSESPSSGTFSPVSLAQLLDEPEPLEPDWILEDILPAGALAATISKPKVGKTILICELAVAIAHGRMFLGRNTKRGNVLILAVEEHRRDVKRRLRNLGVDHLDAIHLHIGALTDSPDTLHAMTTFIKEHAIVLVIIDTLNSYWSVTDENNAAEVTKAVKPLLQLARDSGATVLLLHHARKAEGGYGDEIRGSGALFSLLDVAMILKRDAVDTQRRLTIISRYAESPPELLLELRDHGYVSLGDPAKHDKAARLTKLANALTDVPMGVKDLAAKAGVPAKASYALFELLANEGKATRSGTGKRGDPFLYSRFVSVADPKNGGSEATNSHSSPPAQGIPPDPEFVASGVQSLEGDTKRNETNAGLPGQDSFLPTPVPPGSNESEFEEEVVDL